MTIQIFDLIKYKTYILLYKVNYKLLPKTFKYYFILMKIVCTTQGKGTNKKKIKFVLL